MKSTGEVMGAADDFGAAFAKAWLGAGHRLPLAGAAFVSVNDRDKQAVVPIARRLAGLGFRILATSGTAEHLEAAGLEVERALKVHEGRPHVVDHLINGDIDLVVNTPLGRASHDDDAEIRRTALKYGVPCVTTLSGALAAADGIATLQAGRLGVRSLQEIHAGVAGPAAEAEGSRTVRRA
jgi:carbamoyl-phosphate synthase large subunit